MRRDDDRLRDILEAIDRIERHTRPGRVALGDELVQTWVIHHLQIIGEAVRKLSDTLTSSHPEVPWAKIVAMRHILVHEYFGVDVEELWAVIERDLPRLKASVASILNALESEP